ncbi:MAG: putative membrane protein [Paraglaciecola sp.]|jgi:uncharacterized membrane protein
MNKTRLAAALTLSALTLSMAQGAQYRIVELDVSDKGQNIFPVDVNASGEIAVNVTTPFNPPIDGSLIDFESQTLIDNLTDIEAAKAGNYNDADYLLLYKLIALNHESLTVQQIAQTHAYLADEGTSKFVPGFDQLDTSNAYSFSNDTIVRAVNDLGSTVGTSFDLFYTLDYLSNLESGTDITYVVNDFYSRAFAQVNGTTVELPPIADTAGGKSVAYDINTSNQVAGYSTTLLNSTTLQTAIDTCEDDTTRPDEPIEVCLRKLSLSENSSGAKELEFSFQRRGTIWQLDNQGNIISTKELGLLYTPEVDDANSYLSRAVAINDSGVAVGDSQDELRDTGRISTFAAVFSGDAVTPITDEDEYFSSAATDINNAGLITGQGFKTVNGTTRSKFFVYDLNTDETVFPADFFQGSSSVARDINNAGMVVGKGEVEGTISNRRNAAFVYNHNTTEFQDLNGLVECHSVYTLVDAVAINDSNVIAATARIRSVAQNILGQNIVDDNGDDVLTDKIVAVRLEPITGGTIDECDLDPDDVASNERKGAGLGFLNILGLLLIGWRRWQ